MPILVKTAKNFRYGQIDSIEDRSIPRESSSDADNWLSEGDRIRLRDGHTLYGVTVAGGGRVSGLHTAYKADGTAILMRTRGKKLEYYDTVTEAWVEIGSDIFGSDADGEEITFDNYESNAGAQVWINSPNSSKFIKIMTANITDVVDQYDSTKNWKGHIKITQNRMFLWGRTKDKTGLYGSKIDTENYTSVSSENVGTGDGATVTFTPTLAFKAGGAKRTCFGISITDTVETFTDDYNGVLTGDQGGTGTINYATGAVSITFNTAPVNTQAITADYQWEDATDGGIADFSKSTPRVAGEGFIFRQDDGGADLQNVLSYNNIEYCMHERKTWELNIGSDDTTATNLIYRKKAGLPFMRAVVETSDGIYYVDDTDQKDPRLRILTLGAVSQEVIPRSISKTKGVGVDLADYRFDKAAAIEYGDYVLFACRHKDSDDNNKVLAYHKEWRSIDILSYYVSMFAEYNGELAGGSSISNDVLKLMDDISDDGSEINNHWNGKLDNLDREGLKKVKRLILQGEIGVEQTIEVHLSIDGANFTLVGSIAGSGTFAESEDSPTIGSDSSGEDEIGGGSTGDLGRSNYQKEFKVKIGKFEKVKVRFVATGIGYASVSTFKFWDIRHKNIKVARKYRA